MPDSIEASIASAMPSIGESFPEEAAPTAPVVETEADEIPIPPVPFAGEIAAGQIWPTLKARSILAAVNGANHVVRSRTVALWAPSGSAELHTPNGWILHTGEKWIVTDESTGRMELLRTVRRCLALPDWLADGRSFLLACHAEEWRIWMISPELPSIRDTFERALRSNYLPDLVDAIRLLFEVQGAIRQTDGPCWFSTFGDVGSVAIQDGRTVCLNVPDLETPLETVQWRESALARMAEGIQQSVDAILENGAILGRLREALRIAALRDRRLDSFSAMLLPKILKE